MTRCPRCQRRFPPTGECPAHGKPTAVGEIDESLPEARPPKGWQLGRMIAIGGTAVVYDLVGAKPAVLKWARWPDRDIRARFTIEAEVLRTVGAPTTPALIEHGTVQDWPYVIMEHVGGETLAAWMSRNGERGGLGEIIAILTRITSALEVFHEAGYVHRDLKPENICLASRGVRLLDFGLAKGRRQASGELTQIGMVVGTPHYIAPEQIRMGSTVDQRADIYSLGVIAYEMLAGQPPFVGERRAIEYQHQVARPPSVREIRAIPPGLDDVVLRCLSKQPDARYQTAAELREALSGALTSAGTLRGMGGVTPSSPMKPLGHQGEVALAWIAGGDPVAIARTIAEVQGIVVRQRGDGMLAAFTATQHEVPLAVALATCRELARDRCQIVLHVCSALVRRSAQGKPTVYGRELETVSEWIPTAPFVGLVLTAGAASHAKRELVPAADVPGFFRDHDSAANLTTDVGVLPPFVGRTGIVEHVATTLATSRTLVGVSGVAGAGKSRVLEAIVAKLRTLGRDVIDLRIRRRFLGDRADDDRLHQALGTGVPTAVLVVDDFDRLSAPMRKHLLDPAFPVARVLASTTPAFEVDPGTRDRVAIELPPLSHGDSNVLLRELLRPARLIPDVLIERLSVRATGNPRLLLALARDVKRRGAIRRHAGSDEWYVAVDELDTLLAPPGPSWLAMRALDDVPAEVLPVLRGCAGLGPRFCADEVEHVLHVSQPTERLAFLVREGIVIERGGWYELEDASLQQAIYEHALEDREQLHARALAYWLAHPSANHLGWIARVAYHAAGANEHMIAVPCWTALARAAQRRGEHDQAQKLTSRVVVPAAVHDALIALDDE